MGFEIKNLGTKPVQLMKRVINFEDNILDLVAYYTPPFPRGYKCK